MKKHKICKSSDLELGKSKIFNVDGKNILLFHLEEGFFATQVLCPHTLAPLNLGTIEKGNIIRCNLHRARFDIKTGEVK